MTAGTREPAFHLHSNASFPLPAAQTRAQASRLERGALRSHRSASLAGPLPTATPPSSTSPTPPRATPPPSGAQPAPGRRACCCPGCGSAVVPPSTIRPDLRQPGHELTSAATPRVDHKTLHAAAGRRRPRPRRRPLIAPEERWPLRAQSWASPRSRAAPRGAAVAAGPGPATSAAGGSRGDFRRACLCGPTRRAPRLPQPPPRSPVSRPGAARGGAGRGGAGRGGAGRGAPWRRPAIWSIAARSASGRAWALEPLSAPRHWNH
jgi:hypothetical protein